MAKQVLYLHGTGGAPNEHWAPSLLEQFRAAGYSVHAPGLPDSQRPNRFVYDQFIRGLGIDLVDAVLVGHSSGATTILNLLQSEWFPHIRAVVLVGVFLNENLTKGAEWYEQGQFDNLFPNAFDVKAIRSKCDRFYFVHGDNDPYCSYDDAIRLCDEVGGKIVTIKGGHHLGGGSKITQLPVLHKILRDDGIL